MIDRDKILTFDPEKQALDALEKYPVLYAKITKACNASKSDVLDILTEVMRFLSLIGVLRLKLTPSIVVDNAWHELILCTRYYHEMCKVNFGRYIHHHPGGEEKENRKQFIKTIQLYQKYYGQPSSKYWGNFLQEIPTSADCGACSA